MRRARASAVPAVLSSPLALASFASHAPDASGSDAPGRRRLSPGQARLGRRLTRLAAGCVGLGPRLYQPYYPRPSPSPPLRATPQTPQVLTRLVGVVFRRAKP